jgi:hypothetical protein
LVHYVLCKKTYALHQLQLWTFDWILNFREEQSTRINTRSTRNRHKDEGYTSLEMAKPSHQRHASSAAALRRQLGLGRGACTPVSSWPWCWGGLSRSAYGMSAALANKGRHSLASCTSPPNVSVYSHTSWVLIIFFVLPKGSDARFSYQNYNSMIIERPKQLNIIMFPFRNTSFIMFRSRLRNIDHSGKRVMHTNHNCLDGLPKCMPITTMFLRCDSVTPNTYIHKRKCINEK